MVEPDANLPVLFFQFLFLRPVIVRRAMDRSDVVQVKPYTKKLSDAASD